METTVDFYQLLTLGIGSGAMIGVFTLVWNVSAYRMKTERNTAQIVATLKGLVSLIQDEGERRLLEAGLATINSPAIPNYVALRELINQYGRPPAEVLDAIRKIASDSTLDEEWKIIGALATTFSTEQLEHAYRVHGGSAAPFNAMVVLVIRDIRARGADEVLRDAGLID